MNDDRPLSAAERISLGLKAYFLSLPLSERIYMVISCGAMAFAIPVALIAILKGFARMFLCPSADEVLDELERTLRSQLH